MICLSCNESHFGIPGRLCPVCSRPLMIATNANTQKMVESQLRSWLDEWSTQGSVSADAAEQVRRALASKTSDRLSQAVISRAPLEELLQAWLTKRWQWLAQLLAGLVEWPNQKKTPKNKTQNETEPKGARLAGGKHERWSGLEHVARLDEEHFSFWAALQPLLNTYVWWFVGTVLVLGGSILGMREAWLVLGPLPKQLTVIAALLLYQALFGSLSFLLSRRSATTGSLLAYVALCLLPLPFAVVPEVYALHRLLGLSVLPLVTIITAASTAVASLALKARTRDLLFALIPAGVSQSLLSMFAASGIYGSLMFVPLFPLAILAHRFSRSDNHSSLTPLLFACYGALAVLVVSLLGVADRADAFAPGSVGLGRMLMWSVLLCGSLAIVLGGGGRGEAKQATGGPSVTKAVAVVVLLAGSLLASAGAGMMLLQIPAGQGLMLTPGPGLHFGVCVLATALFLFFARTVQVALHPFFALSMLCGFLFARDWTGDQAYWVLGAANVPLTMLLLRKGFGASGQRLLTVWGVCAGTLACATIAYLTPSFSDGELSKALLLVGCLLGVAVHAGSPSRQSLWHYGGVIGSFAAAMALLPLTPPAPPTVRAGVLLVGLAILYSAAGLVLHTRANSEDLTASDPRPLEDISLALACAALLSLLLGPQSLVEANTVRSFEFWGSLTLSALFFARSFRDGSRLVSSLGAAALLLAGIRYFGGPALVGRTVVVATVALLAAVLASVIPVRPDRPQRSRLVFGILRLPFPGRGGLLLRDAFGILSFGAGLLCSYQLVAWLGQIREDERLAMIAAGSAIALVFVIAFVFRGFESFAMRGRLATAALALLAVGLTAVVNRYGRPLPPMIVGVNLTMGIILLWLASRLLYHKGAGIADKLGVPGKGKRYHLLPLAAAALLGVVLLTDAWLIGFPTMLRFGFVVPPTFLFGAGLATFAVAHGLQLRQAVYAGVGFWTLAIGLGFAQSDPRGIELIALQPPGNRWIPATAEAVARLVDWRSAEIFTTIGLTPRLLAGRLAFGVAVAACLWALLSLLLSRGPVAAWLGRRGQSSLDRPEPTLSNAFAWWVPGTAVLLTLLAWQFAFVSPALLAILAGTLLLTAKHPLQGAATIYVSAFLLMPGLARQNDLWFALAGPAMAWAGLLLVVLGRPLARATGLPYGRALEIAHIGAFILVLAGGILALAHSGSPANPPQGLSAILESAWPAISAALWTRTFGLGFVLLFASLTMMAASIQWRELLSTLTAATAVILAAAAAIAIVPFACSIVFYQPASPYLRLAQSLPYLLLLLSLVAAVAYVLSLVTGKLRQDWSRGAELGSDGVVLLTGVAFAAWQHLLVAPTLPGARLVVPVAIVIVFLACILIAWQRLRSWHIYFAQLAMPCLYLALRPLFGVELPPEADALFTLGFGFVLVGVLVLARRAGIPPLAQSVQRFAAVLPLLAALALPMNPSLRNAGLAALAGLLYSMLALASGSRFLAALAALAVNIALLTFGLTSTLVGVEAFLTPLGLLTILLGQIFGSHLPKGSKAGARLVGGLLLYLPAAVKIGLEIGRGGQTQYLLLFVAICLVGIAAGMILKVRSYLFMGSVFLLIAVSANLVQSGLRDQRLAFVFLSLTGISIIGALVVATLRREQLSQAMQELSQRLGRWD